jgi:hypothetical protein
VSLAKGKPSMKRSWGYSLEEVLLIMHSTILDLGKCVMLLLLLCYTLLLNEMIEDTAGSLCVCLWTGDGFSIVSIYRPVYMSIDLSIYLSTCLSTCLSVYRSNSFQPLRAHRPWLGSCLCSDVLQNIPGTGV